MAPPMPTTAFSLIAVLAINGLAAETNTAQPRVKPGQEMTLDQCLTAAVQNNRRRPASRFAVAMAEAQHRQALAAYWPNVTLRAAVERLDENPNFIFPSRSIPVPAQNITIPFGGSLPITIPGLGTIPLSTFQIPEQSITVPAQEVILQDRDSAYASLGATWLLYDGGMRKGYREQGKGLVDLRKEEARRTDLEIADSVKRFYYGSVLAAQVHQVGKDTLARMEATLHLTETMYKEGSGRVKKTDWLENKVMVESLRSMVALLEKNEAMARAALANTMGLPWNEAVKPADKEMPYKPYAENLDSLVSTAYQFSPDWSRFEAALRAVEGAARTAQSGHHPKLAVTGGLHRWWNASDGGMATEANREGWTVGVGLEIPLFDGFLTRNRVAEARAQLAKMKEEKILLKEGIALQIKDTFLSLDTAQKAHAATLEAMNAAVENRDLNTRAYQNDLVETEKVIRAQLMEALMSATHYKARYDHIALQSQIALLVGTELINRIEGAR
ncbi:MAG: TolC family protein [Verrucomicrobia bacterium]|nr:TolC family protein [Verrucomicrobiota bacterium]